MLVTEGMVFNTMGWTPLEHEVRAEDSLQEMGTI